MDIFADISAVQTRIAQITGTPSSFDTTSAAHAFGSVLASALGTGSNAPPFANSDALPTASQQINSLVGQNSTTWQVDPSLVKAIIANESGFDANATSNVGAQGLMQLMPDTAAAVGVQNPYDPAQNVAGGTRYLRGLLDRFNGNVRLAVAAYNAGPGAVEKYGDVPPYRETQNYVTNVLDTYARYRSIP